MFKREEIKDLIRVITGGIEPDPGESNEVYYLKIIRTYLGRSYDDAPDILYLLGALAMFNAELVQKLKDASNIA